MGIDCEIKCNFRDADVKICKRKRKKLALV